jgi:beta-lactamase regulating signal transducer with metallopeptidase domain
MTPLIETLGATAIRGAVLMATIAIAVGVLRRASASTRHALWAAGFAALLLLPLTYLVTPRWTRLPNVSTLLPAAPTPLPATPIEAPTRNVAPTIAAPVANRTLNWPSIAALLWLAGGVATWLYFVAGRWRAARMIRRATPVVDARLRELLHSTQSTMRVHSPVSLRLGDEQHVPYAAGVITSTIVLPMSATTWPDARLRAVLLHELAHVRRRDGFIQLLVDTCCALHWFNPLVWYGSIQLVSEREIACDDLVVTSGTSPFDYAEELLAVADAFRAPVPRVVLAITRPGALEHRIRSLLDTRRARSASVRMSVATSAAVLAFHVGVASLSAADVPTPSLSLSTDTTTRTFSVPVRPFVCGGGIPDEITYDSATRACQADGAEVTIVVNGGRIVDVHATVGARTSAASAVDTRAEARALLDAIPSLSGRAGAHAIQTAALMRDGVSGSDLLTFVNDASLDGETRRMGVTWFGIVAGDSAGDALVRIARREGDDTSVREQALIALGRAGVDVALEIARSSSDERMRRIAAHRADVLARP